MHGGQGGEGHDTPAGDGSVRLRQPRIIDTPTAAQQKARITGRLDSKMQPARCGERDARSGLSNHPSQANGPQAFFHRSQHMPTGLKVDHALRRQPDASKGRREEVGVFLHPQDGALLARQYPGEKQRRSGTVLCLGTSAGGFVQSDLQAVTRQKVVDRRQAEF